MILDLYDKYENYTARQSNRVKQKVRGNDKLFLKLIYFKNICIIDFLSELVTDNGNCLFILNKHFFLLIVL
jgi:hypothetical protein